MFRIHLQRHATMVLALAVSLLAVPSASAITGGAAANPAEAPWMVKLAVTWPNGQAIECSGQLLTRGVVLTAGHCVSLGACDASVQSLSKIVIRFADRRRVTLKNPTARVTRAPGYRCATDNNTRQDLATIRFKSTTIRPTLPIASPEEIASLSGLGVTAFGGGQYGQRKSDKSWFSSAWTRKSRDTGLLLAPFCQIDGSLCVTYNGSTLRPGDSGGALVGWFGSWKLMGVLNKAFQLDNPSMKLGSAISLAEPTARDWVVQQQAAPFV